MPHEATGEIRVGIFYARQGNSWQECWRCPEGFRETVRVRDMLDLGIHRSTAYVLQYIQGAFNAVKEQSEFHSMLSKNANNEIMLRVAETLYGVVEADSEGGYYAYGHVAYRRLEILGSDVRLGDLYLHTEDGNQVSKDLLEEVKAKVSE